MSDDALNNQPATAAEDDPSFEHLVRYLKEARGFDFTGYKRPSLMRRVRHQMSRIGITAFDDYYDYLQVHPDEFAGLFNTILINVTGFFRDADAWRQLRQIVIPYLLERVPEGSIRLWSAGCATGQEAYSLAMLFAEQLGTDAFCQRVKIYGTDVDEGALAIARQAIYTEHEIADVPEDLQAKFFEPTGSRFVLHNWLRRCVIFGRNDLLQDAPIGRLDLLACRNTLMYFNAEAQARIVNRFGFALKQGGILFLGKAEMLTNQNGLFRSVDLKRRIFTRMGIDEAPAPQPMTTLLPVPRAANDSATQFLRGAAFLASPVAQIVLDRSSRVRLINGRATALFRLSDRDLGRPFRDLELSYRPAELRSQVDQVMSAESALWLRDVEWHRSASERLVLDIQLVPLVDPTNTDNMGVAIAFHDVSRFRRLQEELEEANRQLESAYEELQSTNEELETTNEELQSTVEELETTNEELQSTNEELETMNEELQSMNDELQSTNEELRHRSDQVEALNELMESILSSLGAAVIVVDSQLAITAWNLHAEDLWGMREDEVVGQPLFEIDSQIPVDDLHPLIRNAVTDGARTRNLALHAVNRRGRPVLLTVSVLPLLAGQAAPSGAIVLMEADSTGQ